MPHALSKGRLVNPPFLVIHVLSILTLPKDTGAWIGPLISSKQSPSALVVSGLRAGKLASCKVFGYTEAVRVKVQGDVALLPEHKHCQVISHARLEVFYTAQ